MDRSWIANSRDYAFRASEPYIDGVERFLDFAFSKETLTGKFLCRCIHCISQYPKTQAEVYDHLICDGIMRNYKVWNFYREITTSNIEGIVVEYGLDQDDEVMRISAISCTAGWFAIYFAEVPVFIYEIAPKNLRGGLTTVNQVDKTLTQFC
ncbi:hypothetical protein NE237_032477 [Protea cynaroides]|uniref:Transposase-associated domain-containing protein n=1 Tax=Protea cynaroides TaxID=273540 RepID=A0A9Q0R351_9MAGN|nr:hypothetical protein NE237_032477 [Protea cynaroides]